MRRGIIGFLFAAPLIAIALWHWSIAGAIGIVAVSHALVLYPTLRANVQWLGPVLTCFDTSDREVWLTIDDGPTADTTALLDLLDETKVRATFFVKGALAEEHPDRIREMVRRGHTVGNHSYSHPSASFWCSPPRLEIERCNSALAEILGSPVRLFRAPVGMKNPAVHPVLDRNGLMLVGWSARAFDTKTDDVKIVVRRILPDIAPGAIILLHQGRKESLKMIRRVVDESQQRGYRFVVPAPERLKTKR